MALEKYFRVTIYVPVNERWASERSLDKIAIGTSNAVEAITTALWKVPGVGEVGHYSEVYELDFGFESYRAGRDAHPRFGAIGDTSFLGKGAIITYVRRDCDDGTLDRVVAEVCKVHPWEHPVIEFCECLLGMPAS
jgi:hypothetical protein